MTARKLARSVYLPSGRALLQGTEVIVVGSYGPGVVLARLPIGNRDTFEKVPEDALEPAEQEDIFGSVEG